MQVKDLQLKRAMRCVLIILLLCSAGMAKLYAQSFTVDDLNYSVNDDGVSVTVTGHANGDWASGTLTIPESVIYDGTVFSVTMIGNGAFSWNEGLTGSLIIPNTVISIGDWAFAGCSGFNGSLIIPNTVTSIGEITFAGCSRFETIIVESDNTVYDSRENCNALIRTSTNELMLGCKNTVIPNTVTSIGDYAFEYCSGLTGDLTIPNSVSTIGDYAFCGCSGLAGSLTIPNSVISIGYGSFAYCNSFSTVNYNAVSCADVDELFGGAMACYPFEGCGGNLVIGENVERIPSYMFFVSSFTGDLTIPNTVTTIGNGSFAGCGFTGNLTIPNSVTTIGDNAFRYCTGFTGNLTIGNSVTSIGEEAFYNCTGFMGSLTIGSSVNEISYDAFRDCTGFSSIYSRNATPPTLASSYYGGVFYGVNHSIPVFVPCGSQAVYSNMQGWSEFTNYNEFPGEVLQLEVNNEMFGEASVIQYATCENNETIVHAEPYSGYVFINWTVDDVVVSTNTDYTFQLTEDITLVANFMGLVTITVTASPSNGGMVTGFGSYWIGDTCTLTATANEGYSFNNWTKNGVVVSNSATYSFLVNEAATYVANFGLNSYTIAASVNPTASGIVNGTGIYNHFETCTLTAIAYSGYTFINWTNNGEVVSTNSTYSFTVTGNANYVAHFYHETVNHYVIASANPNEGGIITGSGTYNHGGSCTLTATPNPGYFFINWTKNGVQVSTNPNYTFQVTENAVFVAHFSTGLPDLHVTSITHSAMTGGQQTTISWTVRNDGTAATPNGAMWNDRVWLSVESRVAANDNNPILLGTFENISALDVGEYYTQTQTFNIPLEVSGEYFLFVLTDAYDCHTIYWDSTGVQLPYNPPPYIGCLSHHCNSGCPNFADNRIYELSEYEHGDNPGSFYNDNFFYSLVDIAVPLVPDLQVTSVIAPNNFYSGTDVNVTATISNYGEVTTLSSSWMDALYFSTEPDFSSATCLATVSHGGVLAVDSSYQVSFTGYIPLTVYGEAYFFVKTDCDGQVYEHLYNNNNVTMSEQVNIILTPPADLEPSELVVPATVCTAESFIISYRITNIGAGNPNVNSWMDKVYICHNADTLDATAVLLKTVNHYGGLQPGASYTINESMALPSSVTSDSYYLYVFADANNKVFEYLFESNNLTRSSEISVTSPDLQITEMTAPEQITSGYPINLSYTLINNGDGAISNRSITDKIYISNTESLNGATWIADTRHNVNLPIGQSMTVTCNATAPTNLTDGTFHLIVVADGNNEIHESNEGNNTLSQYPMPVMHQPLPDLQPVSFNLPSTIQAEEAVNVDFDITNLGDLDLLNSNCTFDVFALQNGYEILCPVQSQTLPLGTNVSIGIGQTVHFVRSILVPASVTSACTTFKLYADKENRVTESNESNNTITTNASVIDCPLPDLTVSNFTLPTMQAGTEAQVSFTVANQGTADFNGSFSTTVCANVNETQIQCPLRQQIAPETTNYSLAIGESLQFTLKVLVPPTVTSACNSFSVVVDATNTVLETNENNNTANTAATVTIYPFNLTTQSFTVPSTVTAGESTSISWTVKNTGTCPNEQIPFYVRNGSGYALVEGEYLPTPWKDKIYLSDDAVFSNNDIQLLAIDHNTVLQPNGTYSVEQTVTLPYSAVGLKYLLCVSDATELTFDNNRTDNIVAVPITVELGVLPDLHLTTLTVEPVMTSDNAYWVHYTVVNEGERMTQRDNWMDAFYISENYAVAGALQLGSKIHNGALVVGASYTDSIEILAPNGLDGDYFLLGFTDATNLIYEHTNEGNNLLGVTVTVVAPDPCDLIAIQPEFPNYAVSGEEMTVSWQLRNIGANPAVGRVRNAVYLSADAAWSSDDVMLGYANTDINIAANQQQACSLSGSLTGIAEGNYYIIVKANILNALNESSYDNNICVSLLTTEVGFPLLAIGEQVDRSMTSDQYIYYKLQVGPEYEGQTLSCTLTTMEQQVANGLYLSHEAVPTLSQYDFGRYAPYAQEIEILIPALEQGDYYLLAKGSTQNGSPQQVSIATSIINFEILHIDADHGSNTGSITTKVTGAKFDSIMDFRLVQGGEYLPAEKVFFSNSTETYTTFDLVDMPAGTYAMEAELPGGIITIKGEAFTIEEGLPAELAVNIVAPSSVRRGNTFPVNIEYGNIGTTDLNVSGFVVVSRNGHPIGFTSDELAEGLTERVFSTAEANGNPDVLRPGYRATKTILVDANTLTSVSLQVYAIRKQY